MCFNQQWMIWLMDEWMNGSQPRLSKENRQEDERVCTWIFNNFLTLQTGSYLAIILFAFTDVAFQLQVLLNTFRSIQV